ncbi:zinc metalloprotease [Erythrobacter sp. 3-20A1M]|uniref:KPN_02809 family neutral zinc metallopeptidase n=1 Tax=Erythrobacter sp. 3-20A1M TaxID=2653850 RepID=UPI001BFC6DEF|nr:neutral zinc metallopeptidase [Erythrobacter sp. 3-20A1M]QWC55784.1 zinc metalloprotease [Erythrobacter sp. 3-20A1M]
MRLNPFNPNDIRVEDQRGMRFPGGGGGKVGCGTLVIALIAAVIFGVDPGQMIGGLQQVEQQGAPADTGAGDTGGRTAAESCSVNQYSQESCAALASLDRTWQPVFQKAGIAFEQPKLVFYSRAGRSGCGAAQSAMGPFYCPADEGIYLDTSFYDELANRLGAGPGDFARLYVIAHEYGHHIQHLVGLDQQVRSLQQRDRSAANSLQVRMELQADCYAGVWAGLNRDQIDAGDFEEGMKAAAAIGDDTLQQNAGRQVNPESFTHGSSSQRMDALRLGMQSGDESQCDRYFQMS